MSPYAIQLRSDDPDLLIEFDLPPGTHALIGASPKAEITLPLTGIPPFSCTIGRFHDGRLYLADLDGALSRRVNLPDVLSIPPYHFGVIQPEEPSETVDLPAVPTSPGFRKAMSDALSLLFRPRPGGPSETK